MGKDKILGKNWHFGVTIQLGGNAPGKGIYRLSCFY